MAFKEDANMNSTAAALTLSRDGQRWELCCPNGDTTSRLTKVNRSFGYSDLREDFYLI